MMVVTATSPLPQLKARHFRYIRPEGAKYFLTVHGYCNMEGKFILAQQQIAHLLMMKQSKCLCVLLMFI
jgi:hypothetical protein